MFVVTISLALILSYAATTIRTESNLPKQLPLIGGRHAREGQFPYQVMLIVRKSSGNSNCGGAILSARFVVTAAHCVDNVLHNRSSNIEVFAGFMDREKSDWVTAEVEEIHIHQEYNSSRKGDDIALLKLAEELPIDNYKIRALSVRDSKVAPDTSCSVSGWGDTKQYGNESKMLQYVTVTVVGKRICSNLLNKSLRQGEMCAGFMLGGKDACQGDSGGPLVCEGLLTGLVSWGIGCAEPNKPGVYTDLLYYLPWMKIVMKSDEESKTATDENTEPDEFSTTSRATLPQPFVTWLCLCLASQYLFI